MAKLTRKTQKIFASNTDSDQITAFGTAKTSSPEYTTDVDKIQSNVFLQGWTPSLMSDLAPYLQDSNGLWYAITRQLAYIYQQGIAEWDVNTEYTQGSLVSRYNNDEIEIYMSLQNNNIGNQLTESSYWKLYTLNQTNKLNIDVSNATTDTKENIVKWGMPDYSRTVTYSQTGNFTPSYNCLFMVYRFGAGDSSRFTVKFGSITLTDNGTGEFPGKGDRIFLPMLKGQTYNISKVGNWVCQIVPFYGD